MICKAHGAEMRRRTTRTGLQEASIELSLYIAGHGTYVIEHSPLDCFFCIQGEGSLAKFLTSTLKEEHLAA